MAKAIKPKVKKESWQAKYAREEAERRVKKIADLKRDQENNDSYAESYLDDFDHRPDMYDRPTERRDCDKIDRLETIVQYLNRRILSLEKQLDDKAEKNDSSTSKLFGE